MLAWGTNSEVETIWKEAVRHVDVGLHRRICLESLRNITKTSVKLDLSGQKAEAVVDFRSNELLGNTEGKHSYIELLQEWQKRFSFM